MISKTKSDKNVVRAKPSKKQIRIAAIVATKTEDMELIVPVDIWRRCHFTVDLISVEKKNSVILSHGTWIKCTQTIDKTNLKQYNAIFLPGGMGYEKFLTDTKLIEHLKKFNEEQKWLFGICAAPVAFYELNLLGKFKATCHPDFSDKLKKNYVKNPIVVDGNFLTAKAAGYAFEFAFKAIEILSSKKDADSIAEEIYYTENKKKK